MVYDGDNIVELKFSGRDVLRAIVCVGLRACSKRLPRHTPVGRGETVVVAHPRSVPQSSKVTGGLPSGKEDGQIACCLSDSVFVVTWEASEERLRAYRMGESVALLTNSRDELVGVQLERLNEENVARLADYLARHTQ